MNDIRQWANDWNIPQAALNDLVARTGGNPPTCRYADAHTEAGVIQRTRLEASEEGARLWRNNCGAFQDDTGRWVRYGLANESTQLSSQIKSSDLIGIKTIRVTQEHVGTDIGQFVAREAKAPGWRYTGTERELAQWRFLTLVNIMGGDARFVS